MLASLNIIASSPASAPACCVCATCRDACSVIVPKEAVENVRLLHGDRSTSTWTTGDVMPAAE
jgi:hypothetical protein